MTQRQREQAVLKAVSDAIRDQVGRAFDACVRKFRSMEQDFGSRTHAIEARVAALEELHTKSLADTYRGTWQPNNIYERGSLVTFKGSLWLCMTDAAGPPGTGDQFRLIVKGGQSR